MTELVLSQLRLAEPDASLLDSWLLSESNPQPVSNFYRAYDGAPNYALFHQGASPESNVPDGGARYLCDLISDTGPTGLAPGALQIVAFDVPAHWQDEVDAWYAREHIDMLMRTPGWLRARRYRVKSIIAGISYTSIALHELRDLDVMNAPERAAARSTPWRATMASEPWFVNSGRGLYLPVEIERRF